MTELFESPTNTTTTTPQGVDLYAFVSSTTINVVIGLSLFLVFCLLRTKVPCYNARYLLNAESIPPFEKGFFNWLLPLISIDDEKILKNSGLDALIYVKFFARAFKLFSFGSIMGIVLLLVNVFGGGGEYGFGAIAVSNVAEGSHLLAFHLVIVYLFTFLCFYLLRESYADYAYLRHRHLAEQQPVTARSVLVTCLPTFCRTQAALEEYFNKLYNTQFRTAAIATWSKERAKVAAQRQQALVDLENALAAYAETGVRPRKKLAKCCQNPQNGERLLEEHERADKSGGVDSIDYYSGQIRQCNEQITNSRLPETATAGFVTFTTLRAAHEATRVILDPTPFSFKCRLAPEMRDVCWENLGMGHNQQRIREILGTAMVAGLIFLSFIPITAIAAVTTLPNLVAYLPKAVADLIMDSPILSGFLSGFLPSLANIIFLALLPSILTWIATFEGLQSFSWIERRMARYFFTFAVLTFFIAQTLASSLLSTISNIQTVNDVIDLLALSVPKFGYFFSIFILMQAFVTLPLALVDPSTLILSSINAKMAKTERAAKTAIEPSPIYYGVEYSNHLLVFVIAVSYAIIQPIILVFASMYFAIAYVIAKYKVLFIAIAKYESGGQFWPQMFTHMCVGLFVSQLTLIGVFGLKQVPIEGALLIPLPFITFAFYAHVRDEFKLLSESLPLSQMSEEQPIDIVEAKTYISPDMDVTPLRIPTPEDTRTMQRGGRTYYNFGLSDEGKSISQSV